MHPSSLDIGKYKDLLDWSLSSKYLLTTTHWSSPNPRELAITLKLRFPTARTSPTWEIYGTKNSRTNDWYRRAAESGSGSVTTWRWMTSSCFSEGELWWSSLIFCYKKINCYCKTKHSKGTIILKHFYNKYLPFRRPLQGKFMGAALPPDNHTFYRGSNCQHQMQLVQMHMALAELKCHASALFFRGKLFQFYSQEWS